jgi:hypothetical protein
VQLLGRFVLVPIRGAYVMEDVVRAVWTMFVTFALSMWNTTIWLVPPNNPFRNVNPGKNCEGAYCSTVSSNSLTSYEEVSRVLFVRLLSLLFHFSSWEAAKQQKRHYLHPHFSGCCRITALQPKIDHCQIQRLSYRSPLYSSRPR